MSACSRLAYATPLEVGTPRAVCCDYGVRGYWFTAPTDFTINSLALPATAGTIDATLQVIRLNNPPPAYAYSTTNDFTSLGYWTDVVSVDTNIAVRAGDIIGILGWINGATPHSFSSSYTTQIGDDSVVIRRLGFQYLGMAREVWTEESNIGYIALDYSLSASDVPEPASLALMGLGLAGLAARRKRARM